jgi:hypothetical protein
VVSITAHEIRLRNNTVIGVHVNSYRTIRGKTILACIFDEIAFWRDETSATPDVETYRAVMPSLVASNGMLIGISTPYRRMGLLHAKHRDHFGVKGDDVLVVQGDAGTFNPTLSSARIEAHRASDPEAAVAEWDAEFRTDLVQFLSEDLIELAIDRSRPPELPPQQGVRYQCFVDAVPRRVRAISISRGCRSSPAALFRCRSIGVWAVSCGCSSGMSAGPGVIVWITAVAASRITQTVCLEHSIWRWLVAATATTLRCGG